MLGDDVLLNVQKPCRYTGGEINSVVKDSGAAIRFALCFPDAYEVGMSCLGLQLLYFFINRRADAWCERIFAPWSDMERVMLDKHIPLYGLESGRPATDFDIIGFSLQYELCYTNVINMLTLAGIPLYAADRSDDGPVICAGGPCAVNPEPLAEIMDFFYIGDGEKHMDEILDIYVECKRAGHTKREFLRALLAVGGVYIPRFYAVMYDGRGMITSVRPNVAEAPSVVRRACVENLDGAFFPDRFVVSNIEIIHDRASVELFRGCGRGCRFCQAGFVNRPVRERTTDALIEQAETLLKNTGHEELSLISLSTSDYTDIDALTQRLADKTAEDGATLSLPSVRADAVRRDIISRIGNPSGGSVTMAPEAGSQRLRDIINKKMTEDEILTGCREAFDAGAERIKLYFMVGLPGETESDLTEIASLCERILSLLRSKRASVNVSGGCFVPKPHTPFQWAAQDGTRTFIDKHMRLKASIQQRRVKYSYQDGCAARIEAALARGDRRVAATIVRAHELGARFDGWTDHFRMDIWGRAFAETGLDMDFYASRERETDEILPWDHISVGVTKEFLLAEYEKSKRGLTSAGCGEACQNCGADTVSGGICRG